MRDGGGGGGGGRVVLGRLGEKTVTKQNKNHTKRQRADTSMCFLIELRRPTAYFASVSVCP